MIDYLRKHQKLLNVILFLNKAITKFTYVAYILLVIIKLLTAPLEAVKVLYVAGIPFVLLSVFRALINTKRPYEVHRFEPLIDRKSNGKSFPSRHVFSIFMIATLLYFQCPFIGIIFFILGVILAVIRVITGVHFWYDVGAGAVIGVVSAILLW